MGLFSRRKSSSIQSYQQQQSQLPPQQQPASSHVLQVPSTDDQEQFQPSASSEFAFPLNDRTSRTNNSTYTCAANTTSQQYSRSFRPTTASSEFPTLTPKLNKKGQRPVSAASRVFFNNGQPITPTGKTLSVSAGRRGTSAPVLPKDISATNFRSTPSLRSLKVKSLDLLKSNPSLKYLAPEPSPLLLPPKNGELHFTHDGRGLFASKTVANLADELDTRGLRKLLDRDSRRYGRYGSKSGEDLRSRYFSREAGGMPGQIPQTPRTLRTPRSRGNTAESRTTVGEGMDRVDGIEQQGRGEYVNPFVDPGPSTIRPVVGSDRSEPHTSMHPQPPPRYPPPIPPSDSHPQMQRKHNLPPILLFGQSPQSQSHHEQSPSKEPSPIILMAPNSARSIETQSTIPRPGTETPILLHSQQTRPPILSMATDLTGDTASSHEGEYETADDHFETEGEYNTDDYGSDTPNALLSDEDDLEDEMDGQEWHDSPVIPTENTPKPSQRMWATSAPRGTYGTTLNTYHTFGSGNETYQRDMDGFDMEMTPKATTRSPIQIPHTTPTSATLGQRDPSFSETESTHSLSRSLLSDDLSDINTPIFAQPSSSTGIPQTTVLPAANTAAPIAGTVIPSTIPLLPSAAPTHPPIEVNIIPPGSSGTVDSEGSWLSGKMDIQNAVRKSFHGSPSPIVLEATSPLRIDTRGKPDYKGDDYGTEGEDYGGEGYGEARVRQGSKARRVEVVDSPSLEGLEARLSGESPERPAERRMNGRNGGILLF